MAALRSCWKPPPCPAEPIPADSRMDPPLAKAEPSGDSGSRACDPVGDPQRAA